MTPPAGPRPLAWLPRLTLLIAGVAVLLGTAVLLGWALDIGRLKSPTGSVAMNPAAAVAFALAGVAMGLFRWPPGGSAQRLTARCLGGIIATVGLLKLIELVSGSLVGVDRLLFAAQLGSNEMAPNTALCFLFLGAALAFVDVEDRRGGRPDQVLAMLTGLIALLALVGYAYGVAPLYDVPFFIPMAISSALGFALVSAGILAATPDRGVMRAVSSPGPGGVLVRRLLPAAMLIPAVVGWLCLAGHAAGLFEVAPAVALFAVSNMIVIAGAIVTTAGMLDRTEVRRREAETSLLQERHLLRELMDHLPDSIFFKDRASRFTRINKALGRRLGVADPAEAVGKTDFDFFTEEHARPAFDDEQEVLRTGTPLPGKEEKETWVDGRQRWVLTSRLPLHDPSGAVVGTFGIARDITARKRAEQVLQQAEEQQRLLLDSTGEGIYGIDVDGNCTFINLAGAGLLGFGAEELRGKNMHTEAHHTRRNGSAYPVTECPIYKSFRTGESCHIENEVFWRKDGTSFPVDYSAYPIRVKDAPIRGAVVTFTDNTERERMRSLLMQSEKLASIGLLSAGIAHEINNPLAYVANNLAVLHRDFKGLMAILDAYEGARGSLAGVLPDVARQIEALIEELDLPYVRDNLERVLTRTREGVQRVTNIVQGLRSLARTDRPQMEEAHLPELVEMGLELIRERLRRRGIAVEQDYGPGLKLRCVSTQIGQVLLNLLTNAMQAIEASHSGPGGRIGVRGRLLGSELLIEVEDNGSGIEPNDLARIFDPFFTTKPVGEGTGLGLAITHGIVTGHGGRIEVQSHAGQGTCFRVFFPIQAAAKAESG